MTNAAGTGRSCTGTRHHLVNLSGTARAGATVVFLLGIGYLVLVPLFHLQRFALRDAGAGYRRSFGSDAFASVFVTTMALALAAGFVAITTGTVLAIAARHLPRSLAALRIVPVLPIVLPPVSTFIGWIFLLSPRPGYVNLALRELPWWRQLQRGPLDVYELKWLVIITGIGLSSFVYVFVSSGLASLNTELLEASRVSGSRPAKTLYTVTLPLLRPVLAYAGGVVVLIGLGQFTGPLLLGAQEGLDVLSTEMFRAATQSPVDYAAAAGFGSPLLIAGLAIVLFQRLVLRDERRYVTHAGQAARSALAPSRAAAVLIACYGVIAIALPMIAHVKVAVSPYWTGRLSSEMTLDAFRFIRDDDRLAEAIRTSVFTALGAVVVTLVIGFVAASLLVRSRARVGTRLLLDTLVMIPLGVPAVIFGTAFLLTYINPPLILYGSRTVILLVYVTIMLPFSTRILASGMFTMGTQYAEASRVAGAGRWLSDIRIVLPLMRPAIGGCGALMFVLLSHEFSASMLVRSSTTEVMGTLLYDYWVQGRYPVVSAMALLMAFVTASGVASAMLLGGRSVLDRV